MIPEQWAPEVARVWAAGKEAERRERIRCRSDGEDPEATRHLARRARRDAVRRAVEEGPLPRDPDLRENEIAARVTEALAPKPRSRTSLQREYRARARDLR